MHPEPGKFAEPDGLIVVIAAEPASVWRPWFPAPGVGVAFPSRADICRLLGSSTFEEQLHSFVHDRIGHVELLSESVPASACPTSTTSYGVRTLSGAGLA